MRDRSTKIECALNVALDMADRSEDPYTQVGGVALTEDCRIIGTACNGLLPGYTVDQLIQHLGEFPPVNFRDLRLPYFVHCETNLCSLLKRGEAVHCVITHCPCASCILTLAVHGIKKVTFLEAYHRDHRAEDIARFYGLELVKYDGPYKPRSYPNHPE